MGLGLPWELVAALLGLFALALALWLSRPLEFDAFLKRNAMIYFGVMAIAVPMIKSPLLLVLFGLAVTLLMRPPPRYRIAFFICFVFLVPDSLGYQIPFPGLNYLLHLDFWMGIAWLYLLPLIVRADRQRLSFNSIDLFYFMFIILVVLLDFRDVSATEGLRRIVITLSLLLLPYIAVAKNVRSGEDRKLFFQAILLTSLVLACASLFVQLTNWDFMIHRHTQYEIRWGLVRSGVTMTRELFGVICGFSLLILAFTTKRFRKNILGFTLLAIALLGTGTRAALLMVPLIFLAALGMRKITAPILTFGIATIIAGSGVILERILSIDTSTMANPYNIEYRQRLISSSLEQIKVSPAFGDANFIESPAFFDMVQGQGIVDIVNRYLQIGLEYGLVTLFFFVGAFVFALRSVVESGVVARRVRDDDHDFALLFAFLIGYLFFIGTFSATSHVGLLGALLLGVARGASSTFKGQASDGRPDIIKYNGNTLRRRRSLTKTA